MTCQVVLADVKHTSGCGTAYCMITYQERALWKPVRILTSVDRGLHLGKSSTQRYTATTGAWHALHACKAYA